MSSASISIIDEVTAIKIVLGSYTRTIPKDSSLLIDTDQGLDQLIIYSSALEEHIIRIPFARVIDPVTGNLEALRVAVKDMLAIGGSSGATSAGQALQLTELQQIEFNLSEPLQVDSAGGGVTYIGYAAAGSATNLVVWAIKRITQTGADVTIEWADGNLSYDNKWDDRLTLTYS